MRWLMWWWFVIALHAQCLAQLNTPTICEEEACRCDPFTRVICNCTQEYTEVTLRPDGAYRVPPTATAIIIENCARVTFLPDTVRGLLQLRNIEIRNVEHVTINERALSWSPFSNQNEMNPGLRILINNSTVDEIASHAIQGRINDVTITNSKIKHLKPFAFSSLSGVNTIDMSQNIFENVDIQAFKQFSVDNFILRGGRIHMLPSRFLSDVEITNLFRMEGVRINYIYSLSFLVNLPKRVLIESNNIETLETDGFHIVTRGPITFRNNTVINLRKGALFGFTVSMDIFQIMGPQELLIDNNTVTTLTPSSLMYNNTRLTLRIDGLNINKSCTCDLADEWRAVTKVHGGAVTCWYELEGYYVSLPTYVDSRCGTFKKNYWIFVVIGIILLLIVAALVVVVIVRRENEKKKKVQIVMPDGKTYRETEFHIVVERAELLTTDL